MGGEGEQERGMGRMGVPVVRQPHCNEYSAVKMDVPSVCLVCWLKVQE